MKKPDFDELIASVQEAGAIRRGEQAPARVFDYSPMDIKAIRASTGRSQAEFARMIGVSKATLQNWEQGRRYPEGPARALLKVAAVAPEVVLKALLYDLDSLLEGITDENEHGEQDFGPPVGKEIV